MLRKITLLIALISYISITAQIINEAPYILTVDELKAWTQDGPTASTSLIATEPLAERFVNTETQFNPELPNDMEIAYLPDGMNNFGNYGEEQSQFNLYNFTNWSYIDRLVWFGGTADQTVQLPSAPWTNAAHRNGVKVFGNVFFAPNAFGGSTATMNNFLEQNGDGSFVAVPIMVAIMEYYNFDGWFINEETNTNSTTAGLMRAFLEELTTAVEALDKEVMWYDAMLLSGSVSWQNRLTANNSVFVQDDADGDMTNGFETRVSSNIFINFFWNTMSFPNASRSRANAIGRSPFDVFTGVDVWPGRNQARFQSGGNNWMSLMHDDPTSPITSFGLFAPNCVYNNAEYSTFNTNPNDYEDFYSEERHMFAGADRNPAIEDVSGFKGYSNWIPASSTIQTLPFETYFNTGHGLSRFESGIEVSTAPWHNMNEQDILPTWQFAFSENGALTANWDFENAFMGGSSLRIEGDLDTGVPVDLTLYKTELPVTGETKVDIIYNQVDSGDGSLLVSLSFADPDMNAVTIFVDPNASNGWAGETFSLEEFAGEEITTIGLQFLAPTEVTNYGVNVGLLRVHEGEPLSLSEAQLAEDMVAVFYEKDSIILSVNDTFSRQDIQYDLYDTNGKRITDGIIKNSEKVRYLLPIQNVSKGVYFIALQSESRSITKKIIIK